MKSLPVLLLAFGIAAHAQVKVGEVSTDNLAANVAAASLGGAEVMSGSAVSASGRAATLRLERGGAVHICPQTTVTASASSSGRELMLAVNSGSLELDYQLGAAGDSLITPDLRLSVAGPASVHVAVDVKPSGDVCVASLAKNNAAVVVSELAGEGTYQVRPGQQIVFAKGSIADAHPNDGPACGCPPAAPPMQRAAAEPHPAENPPAAEPNGTAANSLAKALPQPATPILKQIAESAADSTPVLAHTVVEMDAPMIYRGSERPEPPPEFSADLKLFRTADDVLVLLFPPEVRVAKPAEEMAVRPAAAPLATATAKPAKAPGSGFFHRIFTALFGSSKSSGKS